MVWPTIYYPLQGRENYYPSKTPFFHFFKLPFLSLSIHKFVRTFGRVNFILQLSGQNPTLREIRTQDRNLEAETTSGHEEGVLTELIRNLLWVCMCIDLVDLKGLIFLMSFISCSYILPCLPQHFLSPEWRDLMETYHLKLRVQWSLTLCTMYGCGSLYLFLSAAGGRFS